MFSRIAELPGKEEDARYYADLHIRARDAYRWLEVRDGHIGGYRQCRLVRPLQMGLPDETDAAQAAADLNKLVVENGYHLFCHRSQQYDCNVYPTGRLCKNIVSGKTYGHL